MSKLQDRQMPQPPLNIGNGALFLYLRELASSISHFIRDVTNLQNSGKQPMAQLDILDNEPGDPFDGMLVYADGTSWNPGSGEGFYGYENGAWVKL